MKNRASQTSQVPRLLSSRHLQTRPWDVGRTARASLLGQLGPCKKQPREGTRRSLQAGGEVCHAGCFLFLSASPQKSTALALMSFVFSTGWASPRRPQPVLPVPPRESPILIPSVPSVRRELLPAPATPLSPSCLFSPPVLFNQLPR